MPNGTKIATCCYCGKRAALVLTGTVRHELACSACGAPLHDLKGIPRRPEGPAWTADRTLSRQPKATRPAKHVRQKKRHKKRKGLSHHMLSRAFDILEDIFD